jgi:hypothetical protein
MWSACALGLENEQIV